MARKGENIRHRKDGRWEGRYRIWDMEKSCRVTKSVYAKTYAEIKEKLAAAKTAAKNTPDMLCSVSNSGCPADVDMVQIASEWLLQVREDKKYSTFVKYSQIYGNHLKDMFSGISAKDFSPHVVIDKLHRRSFSSSSLTKSVYSVANLILKFAHERYGTDYCHFSPNKEHKKSTPIVVFTASEQKRLLMRILKDMYEETNHYLLGILVCLYTGLRLGEICALKWEDIDFDNGLLYVNRTVQRIKMEGRLTKTILLESEPKSATSKREIPVPDKLLEIFKSIHEENLDQTYVIRGSHPAEPRTMYNHYHALLQSAGIEKRKFHSLRHTFATNCVNAGADVKSISEILGHADVSITLNRYVHPTVEIKRQHMNAVCAIMGQGMGQGNRKTA